MKQQKSKPRNDVKKILLYASITIVIVFGVYYVVAHFTKDTSTKNVALEKNDDTHARGVNSIDYSPSDPADNMANEQRKNNPSKASDTLNNGPLTNDSQAKASVTITRVSIVNDIVQVGTLINGATTGNCILTLSQSGQQDVTRSVAIEQQNNSYNCPVFNVAKSQLPNQGKWNVSVTILTNGESVTASWPGNPVNTLN